MAENEQATSEKKPQIWPRAAVAVAAFLLGAGVLWLAQKSGAQPQTQTAEINSPTEQGGELDTEDVQLKALAEKYDITVGKASLILEVTSQKPELAFETLVPMSINEIAQILTEETSSGEGQAQGDEGELPAVDNATGGNAVAASASDSGSGQEAVPTQGDTGTAAGRDNTQGNGGFIGDTAAKEAALADAGTKEGDTSYMSCYMDYDDGRAKYYKVEFYVGNTEYEYEIDLYSGNILKKSTDTHNINQNNSGVAGGNSGSYIGEDAAWAAALSHAGVDETEVRNKKVKLEEENGVMVYEVEFDKGRTEYDYEIHAVSGEVIKAETDMD